MRSLLGVIEGLISNNLITTTSIPSISAVYNSEPTKLSLIFDNIIPLEIVTSRDAKQIAIKEEVVDIQVPSYNIPSSVVLDYIENIVSMIIPKEKIKILSKDIEEAPLPVEEPKSQKFFLTPIPEKVIADFSLGDLAETFPSAMKKIVSLPTQFTEIDNAMDFNTFDTPSANKPSRFFLANPNLKVGMSFSGEATETFVNSSGENVTVSATTTIINNISYFNDTTRLSAPSTVSSPTQVVLPPSFPPIQRPRDLSNRPADVYFTNYNSLKIIIERLMIEYRDELEDKNGDYYKVFDIMSRIISREAFLILFVFFTNLDRGNFSFNDYFTFVNNENIKIDYESIVLFISKLNSEKSKIMLNRFLSSIYNNNYGNFNKYITDLRLNRESNIFFRVNKEDSIFDESKKFILKADINQFNSKSYRNKIVAEKEYWNNMGNYPESFNTNVVNLQLKSILNIIKNKNYGGNTMGFPVFLEKELDKSMFLKNNDLDRLLIELLKGTYSRISYSASDIMLRKMSDDLVDFYNFYEEGEPPVRLEFDYSKNSLDVPRINDFLYSKTDEIVEKFEDIQNIKFEDFKEINFYYLVMYPFAKIATDEEDNFQNLAELRNSLVSEYNNASTQILDLLQYLRENGKYL